MTILSKDDMSDMITAEFVVKEIIPPNYKLQIIEMDTEDQGGSLRLVFNITKEYIN